MDTIRNEEGERIDSTLTLSTSSNSVGEWLVILGHGLTGDKDRPLITDTAAAMNQAGFDTLRISFSGNGQSEGNFEESTITKEFSDLGAVIDEAAEHYSKIAYVGHSMGCAVGVLRTSKDPRIHALISLAGMVDCKKFAEDEFSESIPGRDDMWDEPDKPLSQGFYDDLTKTIISTAPAAEHINIPWLLIHGTADDVVLPADTQTIAALNKENVETHSIEGADHQFSDEAHKREATQRVASWLSAVAVC